MTAMNAGFLTSINEQGDEMSAFSADHHHKAAEQLSSAAAATSADYHQKERCCIKSPATPSCPNSHTG